MIIHKVFSPKKCIFNLIFIISFKICFSSVLFADDLDLDNVDFVQLEQMDLSTDLNTDNLALFSDDFHSYIKDISYFPQIDNHYIKEASLVAVLPGGLYLTSVVLGFSSKVLIPALVVVSALGGYYLVLLLSSEDDFLDSTVNQLETDSEKSSQHESDDEKSSSSESKSFENISDEELTEFAERHRDFDR